MQRARRGAPSPAKTGNRGTRSHRRDEFHALVEAIHATTRKVLSFLEIASDNFRDHRLLGQHKQHGRRPTVCTPTPTIS